VKPPGFDPGTPVLVYLHSPREKVFGVLVGLHTYLLPPRTGREREMQPARGGKPGADSGVASGLGIAVSRD
jgi:hypothetical protein